MKIKAVNKLKEVSNLSKVKKLIVNVASLSILMNMLSACAPVIIAGAGAAIVGANVVGSSVDSKTNVSDKSIQFKAISLLNDYPELTGNSNVEPVVFNHILLLIGQVLTESLKAELANRMAKIPGVKVVYNQLTIGETVGIGGYLSDSWITSKVISALISSGVNSLKFKVVTEKGVVYILGVVTKAEGARASAIATNVPGVQKVIEVYDYVLAPQPEPTSDIEYSTIEKGAA